MNDNVVPAPDAYEEGYDAYWEGVDLSNEGRNPLRRASPIPGGRVEQARMDLPLLLAETDSPNLAGRLSVKSCASPCGGWACRPRPAK